MAVKQIFVKCNEYMTNDAFCAEGDPCWWVQCKTSEDSDTIIGWGWFEDGEKPKGNVPLAHFVNVPKETEYIVLGCGRGGGRIRVAGASFKEIPPAPKQDNGSYKVSIECTECMDKDAWEKEDKPYWWVMCTDGKSTVGWGRCERIAGALPFMSDVKVPVETKSIILGCGKGEGKVRIKDVPFKILETLPPKPKKQWTPKSNARVQTA